MRRTVELLRRYSFLEESCLRALAVWFLRVPRYEDKIAMGYQLWAHAERANDLRRRLGELRGGHHAANVDPSLDRVGQELLRAPDSVSFLAGWRLMTERLADAYAEHLKAADPSANAQEIRLLRRLEADARETVNAAQSCSPEHLSDVPWAAAFAVVVQAAGGVRGCAHVPAPAEDVPAATTWPLSAPAWPGGFTFDDRIRLAPFDDYSSRMDLPFERRRLAELEIYFNEFYAAGLLATIISDAWTSGAPWEFYFDMAHHFWDEVRHAQFGMVRLRELGAEPTQLDLRLFDASRTMPFLHRLCYLTLGLEVFFMPRKRPRVKRYAEAGDRRTQLFADVDWSDEGNHVQYGKRWVEFFLRDDARSVEELQEDIATHLKNAGLALPDGQLAPY